MFEKILKFFIENTKLNYMLFVLVFVAGIYSYTKIPKEIFPAFEPDSVTITGSYSGASVDILNKMAVQEIEDETKNLNGVKTITSVIIPGRFTVILELKEGENKNEVAEDVKNAIASVSTNLPSDMDEPTVQTTFRQRSLMHLVIRSDVISRAEIKDLAKTMKSRLFGIDGISEITIYGDSDRYYEVLLDDKKIEAYGLSKSEIFDALSSVSYLFPLGKIEDSRHQFFLSTANGKKSAAAFEATQLRIGDSRIYLKDIATIYKRYEDSATMASMNGENSITMAVKQNVRGDAIKIVEQVRQVIEKMKAEGVTMEIKNDQSVEIKDRLNIIISNILLGIILITLLTMVLINSRMALIIALGIPTSFVIGSIYFYFTGYSINMNSLIGVLIALGILVDDAIVVSENIQQYIEKGYEAKEAAFLGAKEMAKPVTLASLTTLFSFIPLLMITDRLGEIVKLVPIAFSALVVASLIESFIFLPIHATHALSPKARVLSWARVNRLYINSMHGLMRFKKTFLVLFLLIVPAIIYMGIDKSRFQMFQPFDASKINIAIKANANTRLEESLDMVQGIERDLFKEKGRFFLSTVSSVAGYRRSATGSAERFPYVMYMTLELQKVKPDTFVDRYITPYLSFYYDEKGRVRDKSSKMISAELRSWLKEQGYQERYGLEDLSVVEQRLGHVKADIRIGVVSDDYRKGIKAVETIEASLEGVEGIKYMGNDIKFGYDEIKLIVNDYGEELGFSEADIGVHLSNLYLSKKKGVVFDENELLEIKIESLYKDDYEHFKTVEIPLKGGGSVRLDEICRFEVIRSLEKLTKDDGETNFYFYANVDPAVATSTEVMKKLQPTLEKLREEGIKLKLKGEEEQKQTLKTDMIAASALAVTLIFISMLYLFNSFKDTFIILSIIPFSFLGVLSGHYGMGLYLSLPSLIGALGLAGVVINDGIIMMTTLKRADNTEEVYTLAAKRFRPIVLTSITTLIGLSSLMFFTQGQAVIFQPMAVALGFGLAWGTVLNLFYLPVMYTVAHKIPHRA